MTSPSKRKAVTEAQAAPPAEAPAIAEAEFVRGALDALPVAYPLVAVTAEELARCITAHEHQLASHIRSGISPSDGYILTIIQTLERLAQIIPTKEPLA